MGGKLVKRTKKHENLAHENLAHVRWPWACALLGVQRLHFGVVHPARCKKKKGGRGSFHGGRASNRERLAWTTAGGKRGKEKENERNGRTEEERGKKRGYERGAQNECLPACTTDLRPRKICAHHQARKADCPKLSNARTHTHKNTHERNPTHVWRRQDSSPPTASVRFGAAHA